MQSDLTAFLHKLETQHGENFRESDLENVKLLKLTRDSDRMRVLAWMETKL